MNLKDFHKYVSEVILFRGKDYFNQGNVFNVHTNGEGIYVAKVQGMEEYTVAVGLDANGEIISSECNCPYDMGPICKHEVAVYFYLIDSHQDSPGENKQCLGELLSSQPKENLVKLLRELAAENDEIKHRIILLFSKETDDEAVAQARNLIQSYAENCTNRDGFVTYRYARDAVVGAQLVFEKVEAAMDDDEFSLAVDLLFCLLEELTDILGFVDDSGGDVGTLIDDALDGLLNVALSDRLTGKDSEVVFQKLLKGATDPKFWEEWQLKIIGAALELTHSPSHREAIEDSLAKLEREYDQDSWSDYTATEIARYRYILLSTFDGQQAASAFLKNNLHLSEFRRQLIQECITSKDYQQADQLAREGEEKDKSFPGLVKQWQELRFQIYDLSGDIASLRVIARLLILDGSFVYYLKLKETFNLETWKREYPQILVELSKSKWHALDLICKILIEEGETQKLMDMVKVQPRYIQAYHSFLLPKHEQEVYRVYLDLIFSEAKTSGNRSHYRSICGLIRELWDIGGKEQAKQAVAELKGTYPRRPALREELNYLGV